MVLVPVIAWFSLPIAAAEALDRLKWKYAVQEGAPVLLWVLIAAAAWLLPSLFLPGIAHLARSSLKSALGLLFWSVLTGWWLGHLAFVLVNCVADPSPAEEAAIGKVDGTVPRRIVITLGPPRLGILISFSQEVWIEGEAKGKRLFVHAGRLGYLWGELR